MRQALVLFVVLLPSSVWPQGDPIGPEFRVNTFTTGGQGLAQAASDAAGNFVVVWISHDQDGSGQGLFAQRYESSGAPVGPEFRVNTSTLGYQMAPAIAADPAGNFVVTWESEASYDISVFGQRYASSGVPLGPEFRVNTETQHVDSAPSVATDSAGNFVIVWERSEFDRAYREIWGRRFASSGVPLAPPFRVNTYTTDNQFGPSVFSDQGGNFVVIWTSAEQDGSEEGVFGQRYDSSGAAVGGEFAVNTYTTGFQRVQAVTGDASGNFVVVWIGTGEDPEDNWGVFGRRYSNAGVPLGGEFHVNTYTLSQQIDPDVASDGAGNFVVTWWSSIHSDDPDGGVFGRRYSNTGEALCPEFRINSITTGGQPAPSVAADPSGRFVVVWYGSDGSYSGVFGQRFGQMVPVELMRFKVE